MLFPRRENLPAHVDAAHRLDYDVFDIDAPDGDFARAMFRLTEAEAPPLFWTPANAAIGWRPTRIISRRS